MPACTAVQFFFVPFDGRDGRASTCENRDDLVLRLGSCEDRCHITGTEHNGEDSDLKPKAS